MMDENFFFISFTDGRFELKKTLNKFKELIKRKGVKCCIIDPFNKVKLKSSEGKNVVDYTNDYLNEIDIFSRSNDVILNVVAHPVKMPKDAAGNILARASDKRWFSRVTLEIIPAGQNAQREHGNVNPFVLHSLDAWPEGLREKVCRLVLDNIWGEL